MSPPWVFHRYTTEPASTMSLIKTSQLWPGADGPVRVHLIFLGRLRSTKVCPAPLGLEGGGCLYKLLLPDNGRLN